MATFEFEHLAEQGEWAAVGLSGGTGEAAFAEAFDRLTVAEGGLSAGSYRWRPVTQVKPWEFFELSRDGAITRVQSTGPAPRSDHRPDRGRRAQAEPAGVG